MKLVVLKFGVGNEGESFTKAFRFGTIGDLVEFLEGYDDCYITDYIVRDEETGYEFGNEGINASAYLWDYIYSELTNELIKNEGTVIKVNENLTYVYNDSDEEWREVIGSTVNIEYNVVSIFSKVYE